MQKSETSIVNQVKGLKNPKIGRRRQIILALDLVLWILIFLKLAGFVAKQEFIDWILNVFVWTIIIVSALLIFELVILAFVKDDLANEPIVLFTVFSLIITINVIVVIFLLYIMGFITGIPSIGVI